MTLTKLSPMNWAVSAPNSRDPFSALQREINRAFEGFFDGSDPVGSSLFASASGVHPRLDVTETDSEVHVTAELPGMAEQDVDVELIENALKIRGEKKDERDVKGHNFHRTERAFGVFERLVALPAKVQRDGVTATFKNGVLTVVLPKAEPTPGPQKIVVKSGLN
jgi:HSP20 family protein